jgi:hypothetical protein
MYLYITCNVKLSIQNIYFFKLQTNTKMTRVMCNPKKKTFTLVPLAYLTMFSSQWFLIKCNMIYYPMYIPPTYLPTYLPNQILIYMLPTHPPTYLPLTYLPIIYLLIYICSPSYNIPIYLHTYLHIIYLPIHPLTYLSLKIKCSHYV